MKSTTKEERDIVEQYIKQLKKLNNDGRIKIIETETRADIKNISNDIRVPELKECILGTCVDISYYIYS